jgi:MFS transporter, DHA2 family, multidrug resistance protein
MSDVALAPDQAVKTSPPNRGPEVIVDTAAAPGGLAINPWVVALVVTLGTFMEVLDTSIANVALPHIAGSLSASQDESTWVLTSYLVANAIILPISGWISSILGRRNFYLLSVLFFTIFSAACGFAPTLGMLVIFRVLQGLAGGGLQPSVQAILADTFPGNKRGMAMALYTVAILCAPVLGPTLGGWITDNYSWRWIFYINIPVGIVCIFFSRIVLHDPAHMTAKRQAQKGKPLQIDGVGLALISIGLASLELVLDKGQELDWLGSDLIVTAMVVAGFCLVGAVLWELHVDKPVVNLRLLKERNFAACCAIVLALYTALYASTFLLPQFMQQILGYDATTAGLVVSPAGIATILEVPIVGWMLSRGVDARKLMLVGITTIALSTWRLSMGSVEIAASNLVWPRVFQVMGVGLTTVPLSTIMFRFLPADQTSNAAGIYALVRNEGGSIGIAMSSTFLQRMAQTHQAYIVSNLTPANLTAIEAAHAMGIATGRAPVDAQYAGLGMVYQQALRQAETLAYMDQYRLFAYLLICLLPLLLLLKRPPKQEGKVELDAH